MVTFLVSDIKDKDYCRLAKGAPGESKGLSGKNLQYFTHMEFINKSLDFICYIIKRAIQMRKQ